MDKFYCNKCEKDVELIGGKCPLCKTDWNKIIEESISYNTDLKDDKMNKYTMDNDIQETINFFLEVANIGKVLCFASAIIIVVLSIMLLETIGSSVLISLISAGLIVLYGFMFEKNVKWKAYMLQINYEILKRK